MVEIVIGNVPPVTQAGKKMETPFKGVEAKLLAIRPPRKKKNRLPDGQEDRRGSKDESDPASGRVMVLLISEGYEIPRDIQSGNYRIFLRFVARKKPVKKDGDIRV